MAGDGPLRCTAHPPGLRIRAGSYRAADAAVDLRRERGDQGNQLASSVRVPLAELAISNGLLPDLGGVVKMLAEELGPSGTRVNGPLPVRIATDRVRQLDAASGDPDEVHALSPRRFRYAGTANPRSSGELPCSYSPPPLPTSRAR